MSRGNRSLIIAVCTLLAAAFVWFDHNYQWHGQPAQQVSREQAPSYDFPKYDGRTFRVVRVVDGDTLYINVPDGNDPHTKIRLIGIDTPETVNQRTGPMYYGRQASEFTRQLVLEKDVTVHLDSAGDTRDRYNRLLAYIRIPDGNCLNELLVSEGYAYAYLPYRHSYDKKYPQLESIARKHKKGLWQNVTRDQLPDWLKKRKPKLLVN